MDRPPVSVVVPFGGGFELSEVLERLHRFVLRPGDEVVVADNRQRATRSVIEGGGGAAQEPFRVVPASLERSSYYTRNAGAEVTTNEWILFMDADCEPDPELLDAYFRPAPAERCGVVAGGIQAAPDQRELLARWARSRRHLSEEHHMDKPDGAPYAAGITPNLLVRREAWESLGGFHEGITSGGDVEICWRIQDAGWSLEHRPGAKVAHHHYVRLQELVSQSRRHSAGRIWLRRRYPGSLTRPRLVEPLGRCAAGAVVWSLSGQFERAIFKLIDAVNISAAGWGWYLGDNAARPRKPAGTPQEGGRSVVMMTEAFPARSETFVYNEIKGLTSLGRSLRVESSVRPAYVERDVARETNPLYLEDDSPRRKLADLVWLTFRHPAGVARDLLGRRSWRREEEVWGLAALAPAARRIARRDDGHIHAHFAAGAALHAMRLGRLLGLSYSITAHAYDIFQKPRNLAEKLEGAEIVVGECDYTVEHMRSIVSSGRRERIHRIRTGADGTAFRREKPYPGGGRVVAVGRHVEKKGFPVLIRAAALLKDHPALDCIEIGGEGPLRARNGELVEELGLSDVVRFKGNVWGAHGVSAMLEDADLLVIPAVPAADGDRDALPVISYEALAMEVPVISSDFVGLPEVVRPPWGRLVPPGDHAALAQAIAEVLELPAAERAEMGRLGREWVLSNASPSDSVKQLDRLLEAALTEGQ